jgi:hypothetical protein
MSLKRKEFSYQVGNLVKCRTEDEFRCLKEAYEVEFRGVTESDRLRQLERTLAKAGLIYCDGEILIKDDGVRWNAVSM